MTYKNLAGLKYISTFCANAVYRYILKTDDDMFIYLRPVITYLRQQILCGQHTERTILCAEFQRHEVVQRNPKSKWYIPWTDFGPKHYPPYCYGGGYILTSDLVKALLETAKKTPFYWIDDVFVTGLVAEKLGNVTHVQLPQQNPIRGYICNEVCMQKSRRWFMHTLQRVDMVKNYFRVLKDYGLVRDQIDHSECGTRINLVNVNDADGKSNKKTGYFTGGMSVCLRFCLSVVGRIGSWNIPNENAPSDVISNSTFVYFGIKLIGP